MKKLIAINHKNNFTAALALTALAVFILAADTFGQVREPQGEVTLFGLQTTAPGQNARLGVVNRLPAYNGEIVPCVRVRIMFDIYDKSSTDPSRLVLVRSFARTYLLDPGEAVSLDLPSIRNEESVSVTVFAVPEEVTGDGSVRTLTATLDLFQGGRKISTVPGIIKPFEPPPVVQ